MGEVVEFVPSSAIIEKLQTENTQLKSENAALKQDRGVLLSVAELMKIQTRELDRQLGQFISSLQSAQSNIAALHQQIPTIRIE
jgi:hypothetical protein